MFKDKYDERLYSATKNTFDSAVHVSTVWKIHTWNMRYIRIGSLPWAVYAVCIVYLMTTHTHTTHWRQRASAYEACDWLTGCLIHRPGKSKADRKRALGLRTTKNRWRHRVIKYALKQYHYKNAMHSDRLWSMACCMHVRELRTY